jgi:hypothetical protein
MRLARTTRATLVAILVAALAFGIAMLAHSAEQNDTEIEWVQLDPQDPNRNRIGQLEYRGGVDIPPMGEELGGLSGLRWDAENRRLLAITDDARWVWIEPVEKDGWLLQLADLEIGDLAGPDGEPLKGKASGDSESLTQHPEGGWLISFERDHRVWHYETLTGLPRQTEGEPSDWFGPLADNQGLEAMATSSSGQLYCTERAADLSRANCVLEMPDGFIQSLPVHPPRAIDELGGVPTDADALDDETFVILFRSYSAADGNSAALVARGIDGTRRELATLRPPLTVDNFEGLAVRKEGERTFLYIVSDDNFSSRQRTLLMKFEIVGP